MKGSSFLDLMHGLPEVFAREGVERAERLVEDQHFRLVHQRPAERGALAHAARQLGGALVLEALQADQIQQVPRALFLLRSRWSWSARSPGAA